MSNKIDNTEEKTTGHAYDGIEELDNNLPRWWMGLFYVTIAFSIGYYAYYELAGGPTLVEEYERDRIQYELAYKKNAPQEQGLDEAQLVALVKDPAKQKTGQGVYSGKCSACHGGAGEGGIGPNLTDKNWLHGGKLSQIMKVVADGVPEKGMPPWKAILKPDEVQSVVAYIRSISGTNPPNAKAPQGDVVEE